MLAALPRRCVVKSLRVRLFLIGAAMIAVACMTLLVGVASSPSCRCVTHHLHARHGRVTPPSHLCREDPSTGQCEWCVNWDCRSEPNHVHINRTVPCASFTACTDCVNYHSEGHACDKFAGFGALLLILFLGVIVLYVAATGVALLVAVMVATVAMWVVRWMGWWPAASHAASPPPAMELAGAITVPSQPQPPGREYVAHSGTVAAVPVATHHDEEAGDTMPLMPVRLPGLRPTVGDGSGSPLRPG